MRIPCVPVVLLCLLAIAGCDGSVLTPPDAATPTDASVDAAARDGSAADAGRDGGIDGGAIDAGGIDAAVVDDAAADPDAGTVEDDASVDAEIGDAGTVDAAIVDGGGAVDAAIIDAGPGTDAAVTTCAISAMPTTGTLATSFVFETSSNGSTCMVGEGAASFAVPCNGTQTVNGSLIGVGTHTITLSVGAGPAGATSCSTTVVVTATSACTITATPTAGTPATPFGLSWNGSGTACTLTDSAGVSSVVPCTGTRTVTGLAVGAHTFTLGVTGGASPTSCTATITVSATPVATTCIVSVTPETGTAATTFVADFTSNGTVCTGSVDALSVGVVDCNGMFSGMGALIGPGVHTARLDVTSGPGGPTFCTDTFTITP